MNHRVKTHIFFLFIILLASLPIVLPLFRQGFFQSDDGEWMIIRFSAFHQALRDGQFPVRWLGRLNHEYGYPVANFLYPGFMYLAEIPKIFGFGFVDSIKIILGLSVVTSAIFIYLWLSVLFDRLPALAGSIFYLYAPYHLFDLYKRGSVGEVLALAVVPFVLWQLERRSFFFSACGITILILSHNIMAVLFLPLIIFYMVLRVQPIYMYTSILIFGIGSASFFFLPAIFDLKYTVFLQTTVANWREYFADYHLIGYSTLGIVIIAFTILVGRLKVSKRSPSLLFFMIAVVSLFFASSVSVRLWYILPITFIQFPFRFLSLAILCTSFVFAFSLSIFSERTRVGIAVMILFATIFFSRQFFVAEKYFDKGEGFYATNMDTTTVHNEYMPIWVKSIPQNRANTKVYLSRGDVQNLTVKSNKITFQVNPSQSTVATINTVYFPGWKAYINGRETDIDYTNNQGIMQLHIPAGFHSVKVQFSETPIRIISDLLSLGFLIGLLIFSIWKKRYNKI